MANDNIGHTVCPVCDFPDAHVRVAKSGRAYILCEDCGCQTFARSAHSDAAIRRKMKPIRQPEPAQEAPAPAVEVVKHQPAKKNAPAAAVVVKSGVKPAEDKTIFDYLFKKDED